MMINRYVFVGIICMMLFTSVHSIAAIYEINSETEIIGRDLVVLAREEDTLMDIANDYGIGHDEIFLANKHLDRWIPGNGGTVLLPTRHILPDASRKGIVLNLSEKRLYYFLSDANSPSIVITYPVGIGRRDWETPLGNTEVVRKTERPNWRPPDSIKQEYLELYGEILPDIVPSGPNNPLGEHALYLGISGYLIHGTNKIDGVGSRISHGCIRLYPNHIKSLYERVPNNTPVTIIRQAIKIGTHNDAIYLEMHIEDDKSPEELFIQIISQIKNKNRGLLPNNIDYRAIESAIENNNGMVKKISFD